MSLLAFLNLHFASHCFGPAKDFGETQLLVVKHPPTPTHWSNISLAELAQAPENQLMSPACCSGQDSECMASSPK